MPTRRTVLAGGLALPLAWPTSARAQAPTPIPIADMHFHSYFAGPGGGPSKYDSRPLGPLLAAGGATLVAWSLVGDLLLVDWKTYKQNVEAKPGEALGFFQRELGRIKAHCAEQGLKLALTPADVEQAMQGVPHIVLAVEGATFIEKDAASVKLAYDLGVRHLQLVHYIRNPLGDIQTESPEHKGLTDLGKTVVRECNRLGILVDLAHCTAAVVRDALAISSQPMVWSHGSVTRGPAAPPTAAIWRRRQLGLQHARQIAAKGGVVGLWALAPDVGATVDGYAARLLEMADWLGEEHVGFGTDINGLGTYASMKSYAEVRQVVDRWQRQGVKERRIRRIAAENYARALKAAMGAAVR